MAHTPTPVKSLTQAADVAFTTGRARPCLARNGSKLVVCSPRTARKHGWAIEGRMFGR